MANQLYLQMRNGMRVIIAVGDVSNWESTQPLPSDVETVDLVKLSLNDNQKAGEYWAKFFQHLVVKSNIQKPKFWFWGFSKINVQVNIADTATQNLVKNAIKSSQYAKRFVVT